MKGAWIGRIMGRSGKGGRRSGFNVPFRDLGRRLKKKQPRRSAGRSKNPEEPVEKPGPEAPSPPDDAALFEQAMAGVDPLRDRRARRPPGVVPARKRPAGGPADTDEEAYAALTKLVSGDLPFDISDTEEYIEGHVAGFDRNVLRQLRRGEFPVQAHLDLHQMSRQAARVAVERFVTASLVAGHRCVLVVHGRGHHSPDQTPVIKNVLPAWLSRGRIGRAVLAFTSAQSVDGGAGALYVLLRRKRQ